MRKTLGLAAAAAMMFGLGAVGAEAMPLVPSASLADASSVTLVRDGCGPYGHRSNYGYCKANGAPVYAPRYAPRCFIRSTPYGPRRICR
jgi:hypothetical protein